MTEKIVNIEYCKKCGGVTKLVRKGAREGSYKPAKEIVRLCTCEGELID